MGKITKDYLFNLSQNYNYSDNDIEITSGVAQLKADSNSRYGTNDPYITTNESLIATVINSFTETSSVGGTGDVLRYICTIDGEDKYYTGTGEVWASSNGSYAQSNLASDLQAHSSTMISGRSRIKFKAFIHSTTGDTTPELRNLNISYDFSGYCLPDDVRSLLVGVDSTDLSDEIICSYIENADAQIDFYVGLQYDLPITNADALKALRYFSSVLSSYNIYAYLTNKEGSNLATLATERYNKVIETLEKIGNGELSLTGLINVERIDISTMDYAPTFNLGSEYAWDVSSDQLDDIASGSFYG